MKYINILNRIKTLHEEYLKNIFSSDAFKNNLKGKLEGGYSIDYALNALVSSYKGKEIIVFDFNKYFNLDNRKSGYEIKNYGTIIIIKFI